MNVFNSLFKKKDENKDKTISTKSFLKWIPLQSIDQIAAIKEGSKGNAVLIFKHSTRCIVSKMVKKEFEQLFDESTSILKVYYLDLLNYRAISNALSEAFDVEHQSPQLLVIKNESAVFHASHQDITAINLEKYL